MANESKLELNLKQIKQMQKNISFEQVNDYKGFQTIFAITKLDLSHPINFGMPRDKLPVLEILLLLLNQ
jgi:hypothetical protein